MDEQIGWSVGKEGTLLKSSDGGVTWEKQALDVDQQLYDICFINSNKGLVVGGNGLLIQTTDKGDNWKTIESGRSEYLRALSLVNEQSVWCTGINVDQEGIIVRIAVPE